MNEAMLQHIRASSAQMTVQEVMAEMGYSKAEITRVADAVYAHRLKVKDYILSADPAPGTTP